VLLLRIVICIRAGLGSYTWLVHCHGIGTRLVSDRGWQAQGAGHRILLSLLDSLELLLSQACCAFLLSLVRGPGTVLVIFRVPVQVATFLPSTDGRLQAVAQVVLAMRRACDVLPVEVDAAARARLADARHEIHGKSGWFSDGLVQYRWCVYPLSLVVNMHRECKGLKGRGGMKLDGRLRCMRTGEIKRRGISTKAAIVYQL
jgi:hypothetical protein